MRRLLHNKMLRLGLSLAAVYLALVICQVEQHFQLTFSDPNSYALLFQHRCGILLVACLLWALFETATLLLGLSASA